MPIQHCARCGSVNEDTDNKGRTFPYLVECWEHGGGVCEVCVELCADEGHSLRPWTPGKEPM